MYWKMSHTLIDIKSFIQACFHPVLCWAVLQYTYKFYTVHIHILT